MGFGLPGRTEQHSPTSPSPARCRQGFRIISKLFMKKFLILFGLLDILTLIRSYRHIIPHEGSWTEYPLMTISSSLLYISLIFSAYFLIRQQKIGLWITYLQFPFRMAFLVLSFGFLTMASRLFNNNYSFAYNFLLWLVIGLEIARVIISIVIHRKLFLPHEASIT